MASFKNNADATINRGNSTDFNNKQNKIGSEYAYSENDKWIWKYKFEHNLAQHMNTSETFTYTSDTQSFEVICSKKSKQDT